MDNEDADIDDNTNLQYMIKKLTNLIERGQFKYPDMVYISTAMDLRPDDEVHNSHGVTLQAHRSLGLTVARDKVYFGKPIELAIVYVQQTDPINDEGKLIEHGSYWLYNTDLLRYEDHPDSDDVPKWQPAVVSKNGVMLYDINNHRFIIRKNQVWHEVLTREI